MSTDECSICCEPLYEGYTLDCKHSFHEECLENCRTDVCPLCRKPFTLLADVYILTLKCGEPINKPILFREFPVLQPDTFNIFNTENSRNEVILQFYTSDKRDKWFTHFNQYNEILSCTKHDIQINVRGKRKE